MINDVYNQHLETHGRQLLPKDSLRGDKWFQDIKEEACREKIFRVLLVIIKNWCFMITAIGVLSRER